MKSSWSPGDLKSEPCCLSQKYTLNKFIIHLKSFDVNDVEENFNPLENSMATSAFTDTVYSLL